MHISTLAEMGGGCAVAETCAAETELAPWPVLAVASITGDSEIVPRKQVAAVSAQAVLDYVSVYGYAAMSKKKRNEIKHNKTKENKREKKRAEQTRSKQRKHAGVRK